MRNHSTLWSLYSLSFPLPYCFALRNAATILLGRDVDEESSRQGGGCFHVSKIQYDLEEASLGWKS